MTSSESGRERSTPAISAPSAPAIRRTEIVLWFIVHPHPRSAWPTSQLVAIYQLRWRGNSSISSRRAKPGSYTGARTTPEQCYFEKILLGLLLDYLADT